MFLAIVCPLAAQQVQGIAVDDETGHALAWTHITLTPLPGTHARSVAADANERGAFSLNPQPGWYILRASRPGFADTEAGQMRAGRPGTPFEITAIGRPAFFQIRLQRLAAITGTVLDSNNVGIPDWPVHVFTARKPLRHVADGITDDRGVFRIGSLQPGAYRLGTGGGTLDDGTPLLPTYYQETTSVDSAEPLRIRIAQTRQDVTVRATKGRLYQISGAFIAPAAARLTLITASGRRVIASITVPGKPIGFTATDVPPGPVEIEAEGAPCFSYTHMVITAPVSPMRFTCDPAVRVELNVPAITARRVSLDSVSAPRPLRSGDSIPPGNWELMPETDTNHYVASVSGAGPQRDGWFPVTISGASTIEIAFSAHPGSISGIVTSTAKPVAGAGVYLQLFNPDYPRDPIQQWTSRADAAGGYQFPGLAPGTYRILSSFDFDADDIAPMLNAPAITLREGDRISQPLEIVFP